MIFGCARPAYFLPSLRGLRLSSCYAVTTAGCVDLTYPLQGHIGLRYAAVAEAEAAAERRGGGRGDELELFAASDGLNEL